MPSQDAVPWYLAQSESELAGKFGRILKLEKRHLEDGLAHRETSPWSLGVSTDEANSYRNRYSNIMPYEKSRVKLEVLHGNDYINASYVDVDVKGQSVLPGHYIATQGPTRYTWQQFWQMCYGECPGDDIVVVMVTPLIEQGREKCFPYWPQGPKYNDEQRDIPRVQTAGDPNDSSEFACALNLKFESTERYDNSYTLTTLTLAPSDGSSDPPKRVHHFYFDQWQDMSRPEEVLPIMKLCQHVHMLSNPDSPIITHCSAGVGRSGTFIALDHMLHNTKDFGRRDSSMKLKSSLSYKDDLIEQIVIQMRSQRLGMVQSRSQFLFLYHAAMYLYSGGSMHL